MSIVAILGAVFGVLLFALFRMQQAANAARDIAGAADEARGLIRRWSWRRKTKIDLLAEITDPREAASIMLTAVAEGDGAMTERERDAIMAEMSKSFGATRKQGEELLARARWLIRDSRDAGETLRRLTPAIRKSLGETEQRDLVAMLRAVANADGPAGQAITHDIERFVQNLKR